MNKTTRWPDWMILETVRDRGSMTPQAEDRAMVLAKEGYIDTSGTWKLTPKGDELLFALERPR